MANSIKKRACHGMLRVSKENHIRLGKQVILKEQNVENNLTKFKQYTRWEGLKQED